MVHFPDERDPSSIWENIMQEPTFDTASLNVFWNRMLQAHWKGKNTKRPLMDYRSINSLLFHSVDGLLVANNSIFT